MEFKELAGENRINVWVQTDVDRYFCKELKMCLERRKALANALLGSAGDKYGYIERELMKINRAIKNLLAVE